MPEEDQSHLTYIVSLHPQKLVKSEAAVSWRVEAADGLLTTENSVPVINSSLSVEPFNRPVGTRYKKNPGETLIFTLTNPSGVTLLMFAPTSRDEDLLTLKKTQKLQKCSHLESVLPTSVSKSSWRTAIKSAGNRQAESERMTRSVLKGGIQNPD